MKLKLIVVGKTQRAYLAEGISEYGGRTGRYHPFEMIEMGDVRRAATMTAEQRKQAEGREIMGKIGRGDFVVLLDERGDLLTSREFAGFVDRTLARGGSGDLVFVVGGPYGFSQEVYQRSDRLLSLSRMTMPHDLVRLMFVEQLYRAMTIRRGEPYHHD